MMFWLFSSFDCFVALTVLQFRQLTESLFNEQNRIFLCYLFVSAIFYIELKNTCFGVHSCSFIMNVTPLNCKENLYIFISIWNSLFLILFQLSLWQLSPSNGTSPSAIPSSPSSSAPSPGPRRPSSAAGSLPSATVHHGEWIFTHILDSFNPINLWSEKYFQSNLFNP